MFFVILDDTFPCSVFWFAHGACSRNLVWPFFCCSLVLSGAPAKCGFIPWSWLCTPEVVFLRGGTHQVRIPGKNQFFL